MARKLGAFCQSGWVRQVCSLEGGSAGRKGTSSKDPQARVKFLCPLVEEPYERKRFKTTGKGMTNGRGLRRVSVREYVGQFVSK